MPTRERSISPESERIFARLGDIRRVVSENAERLARTGGWPEYISPDSILERVPDSADDVVPGFDAGIACTLDLIPRGKQELSARLHANYDKAAVMKIREEAAAMDPDSETTWWLAACSVCSEEERPNGGKFLEQIETFKQIAKNADERVRVARKAMDHMRSSFSMKDGVPFGTEDGCIQGAYVAGYPFGSMYSEAYGIYFIGTYEDSLGLEDFVWSEEKDEKQRPKSGPVSGSRQFVKCANEEEWRRAVEVVKKKLPVAEREPADARQARVERLRAVVLEIFPGDERVRLREKIDRSFLVPQVGDYHNEGAFMDSHLALIIKNIESVERGEFPEDVPAPARAALVRAVRRDADSVKKYVFLHDIAKADCLTVKFGEEGRAVSWDEWQEMLAASDQGQRAAMGNEDALRAFCAEEGITGVSYFQNAADGKRQHGTVGAAELRASGVTDDDAMLAAIETHEVAYLFEKISVAAYERYFGGMSDDARDFALLASYVDTMASIRPDGRPDLSNFLALAASREKFESLAVLFFRLDGGKSLDKGNFDRAWANLRKSSDPLSEDMIVGAEARIRAECRVVGYDVEKLRTATDPLVEAGTLTPDERDRLLVLASSDPRGIGRVFGQKMRLLNAALDASRS